MNIHERQEIAEAILNELHFRRYNEAIANGCNEKDAMTLADNWELYKDAQTLFKFYVDLYDVSARLSASLGEVEGNKYEVVFDKDGQFWINHKEVGSGEPLKQWIDGVLNVR